MMGYPDSCSWNARLAAQTAAHLADHLGDHVDDAHVLALFRTVVDELDRRELRPWVPGQPVTTFRRDPQAVLIVDVAEAIVAGRAREIPLTTLTALSELFVRATNERASSEPFVSPDVTGVG